MKREEILNLIYLAKENGINLFLKENRLRFNFDNENNINQNLIDDLRSKKEYLLAYFLELEEKIRVTSKKYNSLFLNGIEKQEYPEFVPLSYSQERLWLLDKLQGSIGYHIPNVLQLKGLIDISVLEKSIEHVVERHESLRTIFKDHEGMGYQEIISSSNFKLTHITESIPESDLESFIAAEIAKPFDLSKDYMLRCCIYSKAKDHHILILVMHHIASDGWSMPILVKEFEYVYRSILMNTVIDLPKLPIQYADYSIWQRSYLSGELLENKLSYWKDKLGGLQPLELPTDYTRPAVQSIAGSDYGFLLSKELSNSLIKLSKEKDVTLFMLLLSVFKVLLYKYTGQEDISVGTPIANRGQEELFGLIGFFVNTLVLRDKVESSLTFDELLDQVKQTALEAYSHQDVPFEKLVSSLTTERDLSRNLLFQVMFIFQNNDKVESLEVGESAIEQVAYDHVISKFDLTLSSNETDQGIVFSFEYATSLFKEETIKRMASHLENIIISVVTNSSTEIKDLDYLTSEEKRELLEDFNDTQVVYPKDETVVSLFEKQAKESPDGIALIYGDEELTYKELDERSNQLAHYLVAQGITKDSLVPICVNRSLEMIVGILGIIKAGGAYVPIDPKYPQSRIDFMLEDCDARIILTQEELLKAGLVSDQKITAVVLDADKSSWDGFSKESLELEIAPDQLVYVIYTSGTTGKPKGVMIEHYQLYDFLMSFNSRIIDNYSSLRILNIASMTFDISVLEFFMPLIQGGELILIKDEYLEDSNALALKINHYKPTIIQCTTSRWQTLKEIDWSCNFETILLTGGESLSQELNSFLLSNSDNCWNLYGPTETTIWSTTYKLKDDKPTVGTPISNIKIHILDSNLKLVPKGVMGELCISGDGLSRGYLNLSELTADKFIDNPFKAGERLYKTGDLGRWLEDGNIEFIGRKDDQVKIRGYRIELGEIESQLEQIEEVLQAVVLAIDDITGNKQLVAYYTTKESLEKRYLMEQLKSVLPEYMIPKMYMSLEEFPLTVNGKVDKRALPKPDGSMYNKKAYVAPRTDTEKQLVAIWEELLGIDPIGIYDNFFDLGGNSITAVRLVSFIQKRIGLGVNVKNIFEYPAIKDLCGILLKAESVNLVSIEKQDYPEFIPLSYSQERLWFLDKLQGSIGYHIPNVLQLKGVIDFSVLEKSIEHVIERHESLRTIFKDHEGRGYQEIISSSNFKLTHITESIPESDLESFIAAEIAKPFDLSKDYMLRCCIYSKAKDHHILILVMHHIASDGWSMPILVKEFEHIYRSILMNTVIDLPKLPIQYADYSIWQRSYLSGELLENKLSYWKDKLGGLQPLELPTDYTRPALQSIAGSNYGFLLSKELSNSLIKLSKEKDVTLFMLLLSVFKVLLYKYTGQEDISVGTPIANRGQEELFGLIGFFVNTLVLRDRVESSLTFDELLDQVKQTALEAYSHQDVPFEKLVNSLTTERDLSRNPLFQIMFIFQNNDKVESLEVGESVIEQVSHDHVISKFDLTLSSNETDQGIVFSFEYATSLFKEETIKRMASHLENIIVSVVTNSSTEIKDLDYLTQEEKRELLEDFNDTQVVYPKDETVVSLFEKQAKETSDGIALIYGDEELTYKELDERSNQLAHYLVAQGITKDSLVPICVNRSLEMIVGIFGIIKAGGAYVPIDPKYPQSRIDFILEDCDARVILTQEELLKAGLVSDQKITAVVLDADKSSWDGFSKESLELEIAPDQLVYVIYTSGTTGNPKGVMIEHRSLYNFLKSIDSRIFKNSFIRLLNITSMTFDISVLEFFMPLIQGGELILIKDEYLEDSNALALKINHYKPTIIQCTPSRWQILKEVDWSCNFDLKILCGGEYLSNELKSYLLSNSDNCWNLYGPTETTIWSTITQLEDAVKSIGKPISNTDIYILDSELNLVPKGVIGELHIGGEGLSRGYLNRPELTKEKFIENPFQRTERLYKTGDLARWLEDGNIEYIGRKDDQVKIRGYRIELGEIEVQMECVDGVQQSVVLALGEEITNKQLVAYYTSKASLDVASLEGQLRMVLPEYMVPKVYIHLEKFPLTVNGKVDRKVLPKPNDTAYQRKEYVAPRTETEKQLVAIWEELLGIAPIGIYDNFFDLGGNSLSVVRFNAIMIKKFNLDLNISIIFKLNDIKNISEYLDLIIIDQEVLNDNEEKDVLFF